MKKIVLFLLIFCFFIGAFGFVFAQETKELETGYPEVGGYRPETIATPLPQYLKYIFNFAIWIGGIVAFGVLIFGGFRYVVSAGNPATLEDARSQIFSGILGLIILLSSYLILTTINPQLVILHTEPLETVAVGPGPGVWLCKTSIAHFESFMENPGSFSEEERKEKMEDIGKNCLRLSTKGALPEAFKDKVEQVYLVDAETHSYGVVLHRDSDFKGRCQVVTPGDIGGVDPAALSATPFFINKTTSGEGVTLYDGRDFGEEEGEEEKGPYKTGDHFVNLEPCYSIEINEERKWVSIAFGKFDLPISSASWCEVFDRSDRNLEDDYTSAFCVPDFFSGLFGARRPCVGAIKVFPGMTF